MIPNMRFSRANIKVSLHTILTNDYAYYLLVKVADRHTFKLGQKTYFGWFKILTLNQRTDSNLSEHFYLYFCSTAKWDILKATVWWAECMRMSVHIHFWYQPCPHSVTIIVVKPVRLNRAAIWPEEKSLHGQRYGLEAGMLSASSFSADLHILLGNLSTSLAPDVSQVSTCPLVI